MNLPFWFAKKYFYSKSSRNVINIIALISQIGITICTAALVIILSVYNGLEGLMMDLYSSFDSDIKIELAEGKYFDLDSSITDQIKGIEGVKALSPVIEEKALLAYGDQKTIATLKGIDSNYIYVLGLDSMIIYGDLMLRHSGINYAILGVGIASKLDLGYLDETRPLSCYFPKARRSSFQLNPGDAFTRKILIPGAVFSLQEEYDKQYVLVSYAFMEDLTAKQNQITSLELCLNKGYDPEGVKPEIETLVGSNYKVVTRNEQHASFYKITRLEKLMTFIILSFILLIAAFNLIGSLLMLSLEKRKDMMVLRSMGASITTVKRIFFYEGGLLSLMSAVLGILLGVIMVILQQHFGFITLGGEGSTFIVDAYPVKLKILDLVMVLLTVILIGFISSFIPSKAAAKEIDIQELKS